jgi:hypothetical protein
MNPACNVAADELIAFTEEDLPERRMRDLEAHVPTCPVCQERLTGARETMTLLRETLPQPNQHARHDLLVRLYQEAERQTDRPHRGWTQAASLMAVGAVFLIATVMFWSGIGQFVDAIPRPFQQASQNQSQQWVADDDQSAAVFIPVARPSALGDDFPVYDWWVRSGIRVIVYKDGDNGAASIEVSQFFADETSAPPGYMSRMTTINGVPVYVDDPDQIQEVRWRDGDVVHHLQFHGTEHSDQKHLSLGQVEEIVRAFLGE